MFSQTRIKLGHRSRVNHEFVEFIPDNLQDGVIYISIVYATASHRCCCGCGNEVVTPISPTDWKLIFDGCTVSLEPSIGNWGFICKSHYWITKNTVEWSSNWSDEKITFGRVQDKLTKNRFYGKSQPTSPSAQKNGWLDKISRKLKKR